LTAANRHANGVGIAITSRSTSSSVMRAAGSGKFSVGEMIVSDSPS
jgi:hypothetical protein